MDTTNAVPQKIPRLPPELHDRIIDYLHDHRAGLKACSLVCHSWVPATRFHVFHSINLLGMREGFERFSNLLASSPQVGFYVRALNITFALAFDENMLRQIAQNLGHVRSFTLIGVGIHIEPAVFSQIGPVQQLAVWASFRSSEDVFSLFQAFPRMQSLHIGSMAYSESDPSPCVMPSSLPLKRIRMDKGCDQLFREMLARPSPMLEDLELYFYSVHDLEAFHDVAKSNGTSLRRLILQVWYCGPECDKRQNALLRDSFAYCTALETVHFTSPAAVSWVAEALRASPSSPSEVVIDGFPRNSAELDFLADTLTAPRLRDLRKVVVKLRQFSLVSDSVADMDLSAEAVRGRLRALDARGVLSVVA